MTNTPAIIEQIMQQRTANGCKIILHYPDRDVDLYAKDREQLDKWIAAARRKNIPWTVI